MSSLFIQVFTIATRKGHQCNSLLLVKGAGIATHCFTRGNETRVAQELKADANKKQSIQEYPSAITIHSHRNSFLCLHLKRTA